MAFDPFSLLFSGLGALFGGASSSDKPSGNTTTTQTNAPWGPQQQYLIDLMQQAQGRSDGAQVPAIDPATGQPKLDDNGQPVMQAAPNAGTLAPLAYPGQMVAPQSWQTQGALQNLFNSGIWGGPGMQTGVNSAQIASGGTYLNANPGNPTFQSLQGGGMGGGALSGIANNAGYNPSLAGLNSVAANAGNNPAMGPLSGLMGAATQNGAIGALGQAGNNATYNPASGYLNQIASGGNSNPYLDKMFNQGANAVQSRVQSQFAGNGRSNSGGETAALADQYNNLATNIYGNAYGQNQQNALSAASTLGSQYNQGSANQIGAYSAAGGLYNQGINSAGSIGSNIGSLYNQGVQNQISALGTGGNLYNASNSNAINAGMGLNSAQNAGAQGQSQNYNSALTNMTQNTALLPGLSQQYMQAQQGALGAGNAQDAYNQSQINALMQQYNQNSNQPYTNLSRYQGLISGNMGGTQTTQQPYYNNTTANVLGGALGAGQLYNQFFPQTGTASNPSLTNLFGQYTGSPSGYGNNGVPY